MKKFFSILLVSLLALTLAAMFFGCGGEKDLETAKSLMKEADLKYDEVETAKSALNERQTEISKTFLTGDMSALAGEQGEQLKKELATAIQEIEADLQEAKAGYEQILQLEGVEKYKEYAGKMLQVVEKNEELLKQVEALMGNFIKMLSSLQPGTTPDLSALLNSEEMANINQLSEDIDNLQEEAAKLKKDLD